jgi:hypothetical protein
MTDHRYSGLLGSITETLDIKNDFDVPWHVAEAMQREAARWREEDAKPWVEPESNVIHVDFKQKRKREKWPSL